MIEDTHDEIFHFSSGSLGFVADFMAWAVKYCKQKKYEDAQMKQHKDGSYGIFVLKKAEVQK